jgi:hypothetical protein
MMTRKDYVKFADVIAKQVEMAMSPHELMLIRSIALDLSDVFAKDNPGFSRDRFLAACKIRSVTP